MKRLSFITQFKIEFLLRLPVVVVEKCLEKCLGLEIFDIYLIKGLDLFFFGLGSSNYILSITYYIQAVTYVILLNVKLRFHVITNFFVYGVLFCTVQLCRAAISMLFFLPRSHSVKMAVNAISEYLAQFLLDLPNLVLIEKLFICIFYFFDILEI